MPTGVVKTVGKAAVVGAAIGFSVATGGLGTPLAIGIGAGAFGLGLAAEVMKPKPTAKEPDFARTDFDTSFPVEARQRTQMIRSSIAPHRIIYGEVVTSGTLVAAFSTGTNKEYLHLVIALAGHQVNSIGDVWLDDTLSTDSRFTGLTRINKYVGTDTQAADTDLVAEVSQWTTNHRLRGIAYIYVRLKWDEKVWIKGIPNIKAKVQGRLVYDPRTASTGYSNNATLCQRDYLTASFGFGATTAEIDDTSFITAANICDENVSLPVGTQKRYTCDGSFTLDKTLKDVMEEMLTSSAGTLVYSAGRYKCFAGSWPTPTVTLDEDDLRGPIQYKTKPSRKDLYNAVKGTFVNKDEFYLPTDFTPMVNATYKADDGNVEIFRDIELPYTNDSTRAQRIAKIHLERSRQGIVVVFPAKLTAFELSVWDSIYINNTKLGWTQKTFRVINWSLSDDGGVDLVLQEDSASAWGWVSGDAETFTPPTSPTLPNPYSVTPPSGLTFNGKTVSWTAPTDQLVLSGGVAEIQYKKSTDATWIHGGVVNGTIITFDLVLLEGGVNYDVRVKFINYAGVSSSWTTLINQGGVARLLKIFATGTAIISLPARNGVTGNTLYSLFTHNLGYHPMVLGASLFQAGGIDYARAFTDSLLTVGMSGVDGVQLGTQLGPVNCACTLIYNVPTSTYNTQDWMESFRAISFITDNNTLYLKEWFVAGGVNPLSAETVNIRYYILVDTGKTT